MNRIRQWIRNQKLYKKIMYVTVSACVLVLLVCFGTEQMVHKAYNDMMYEKTTQIFTSYSNQVEMQLKELNVLTLTIIGDNAIQENLITVRDTPVMTEPWRKSIDVIREQFMVHFFNTDIIRNYELFAAGRFCFNVGNYQEEWTRPLLKQAREARGSMVIVLEDGKVYLVRQIRQIVDFEFTELGVIFAELDMHKIIKESNRNYQKVGVKMNLSVYADDNCVYADDAEMQPLEADGWMIRDDDFVVQCTTNRGWKFVFQTPYGEILHSIRTMILRTMLLSIVIVTGILVICRYTLSRIFRHLDKLVLKFDDYSTGKLPSEADMEEYLDRKDEIGHINRRFMEMAYKHKALEEENFQRMLLQKEAEYQHLQQQIRPHFIFNTLSQIMWMAYHHGDEEIAELTDALSKLIRGSMTFNEKTITARQELELVEKYMHIQKVRYENRMRFRLEVPETMMHVLIPQMTIQPIVENAIAYAVEEMLDLCEVTVSGRIEGDKAVFVVEDNGPGIDPDILHKLVNGETKARGNGIGLLNVQQRIQLAFGESSMETDKYGLSFHRIREKTQVWITVPFTEPDVQEEKKAL